MIHYSCDKCSQPITSPGGVATITIKTQCSDTMRMHLCKHCTRGLLPEDSPRHKRVSAVAGWMDAPDEAS